jgi:cell division transport system permease protein
MKVDYVARETVSNLRRNLLLTTASVLTVAVSLSLVGAALLLRQGVDNATGKWRGGIEFEVFVNADATPEQEELIGTQLQNHPDVQRVQFVSQEEQYRQFKVLFHDTPEYIENVSAEVLPPSYRVVPRVADVTVIRALGDQFNGQPGVHRVVFADETVETVLRVSGIINIGILIIATVLVFAAALLIFNTIRMAIFARRREIEVMKLVGATNWFIRVPFMIEGLLAGLLGAGLSFAAVYFLRNWAQDAIRNVPLFDSFVVTGSQVASTGGFMVLAGALIGAIGAGVAVTRFLDV